MKVLHFGTLDYNAGGPAMSGYLTLLGLRHEGVDALIAMFPLSKGGRLRGEDVPYVTVKAPWEHKLAYSLSLKKELRQVPDVDIYHAQGVWQYPTYAICDVAKTAGKPYLITPRGMLYPQDIAKSNKTFKLFSLKWRLLNDLNHAACVHVTCEDEMRYARELGVTAPIAIIPNPVEVKEYLPHSPHEVFTLGYMGRISRRKNVESLIYAFAELGLTSKDARLVVIGGGDETYGQFLKSEVQRLKLDNVEFKGFLRGKEKDETLTGIDVLAMPSEFENLGNVVLEGLVRGIPCIATKGSPWKDLVDSHCGWWTEYRQTAITDAIRQALHTDHEQLSQMGENGKRLMAEKYSVEAVGRQMKTLYEWILGKENTPQNVFLK